MTTREQIFAAASSAGIQLIWDGKFGREDYHSIMGSFPSLERFYAIAFEAGRVAEREACAVIAETPVYGEQDDITMEAKDRIAKVIRERSTK